MKYLCAVKRPGDARAAIRYDEIGEIVLWGLKVGVRFRFGVCVRGSESYGRASSRKSKILRLG